MAGDWHTVETASAPVIPEGERFVSGGTLLSPTEAGHRTGPAFEEKVLLLSNKAVYTCSYEYSLQKVCRHLCSCLRPGARSPGSRVYPHPARRPRRSLARPVHPFDAVPLRTRRQGKLRPRAVVYS